MACNPAPSCVKMLQQADEAYPNRNDDSDGICGNLAHRLRKSDHNRGKAGYNHAVDLSHDPANGCNVAVIAEAARVNGDWRVRQCIFNRRIWTSYSTPWRKARTWGRYVGVNPHRTHGHFGIHDTKQACENTSDWAGFEVDEVIVVDIKKNANAPRIVEYFKSLGFHAWHVARKEDEPREVVNCVGVPPSLDAQIAPFLIGYGMKAWRQTATSVKKIT